MLLIDDYKLIRLYQTRSEGAIALSELRYGAYCRKIAMQILGDPEDVKEYFAFPFNVPEETARYIPGQGGSSVAVKNTDGSRSKKQAPSCCAASEFP